MQQVNRRILGRLRPAALEEMGLADALQALAQGWREANPGVAIALSLDGASGDLEEATALTAYRIVQEGLANALRHSGADQVTVIVTRAKGALHIVVRDNGAGLDAKRHSPSSGGLGLRGMSERVGALGGALMLNNEPEGGARLTASLPLRDDVATDR